MSRGSGRIIGQRIRIRPCDDESASSSASSPLDLPSVSSAYTPPFTIRSICNATSSPDPHCGSSDPKLPHSGKVLSQRHDAWRVWLSMVLVRFAVTKPETSLRLSPRERMGQSLTVIGRAYFFKRRFEEAAAKLLLSIQDNPSHPGTYRFLAAFYTHLGRLDEARAIVARLRTITPLVVPS